MRFSSIILVVMFVGTTTAFLFRPNLKTVLNVVDDLTNQLVEMEPLGSSTNVPPETLETIWTVNRIVDRIPRIMGLKVEIT